METRKAIRKIKKLLSFHGGYPSVAVLLQCTERWVRNMEKGENPGDLRYALICNEYESVKKIEEERQKIEQPWKTT